MSKLREVVGISKEQGLRIDALRAVQREMKEKGTPMPQDGTRANMVSILGNDDF